MQRKALRHFVNWPVVDYDTTERQHIAIHNFASILYVRGPAEKLDHICQVLAFFLWQSYNIDLHCKTYYSSAKDRLETTMPIPQWIHRCKVRIWNGACLTSPMTPSRLDRCLFLFSLNVRSVGGSTKFTLFDAVTSLYVIVELRAWRSKVIAEQRKASRLRRSC